jgi:hypothetical protein
MLSENEQRRLAEIESSLSGDDPGFVHRFGRRTFDGRRRRRRLVAVLVAICGAIGAIVGLAPRPHVAVVVLAMCSIGVAAGIYTWRPAEKR